jgi:AcrR family transcriptional regulator
MAREALVSAGVDDVKVDRLARKLKVTRGSFYHHFKHRQELLDALLDDWDANNKRQLDQLAERLRESSDLSDLWRLWLGEDPAFPSFDMAIRIWARKAPKIAKVVHRVDDAWIDLFQRFFLSSGMSELESLVRARVVYFHQIGYYALAIDEGLDERIRLAPYYYRILLGTEPSASLAKALSNIKKRAGRPTSALSE